MIVHAVHGAAHQAGSENMEGVVARFRMTAQGFQHGDHRGHPIGFLQPKAADVGKDGPMKAGGGDGEDGHQVGNVRGIDGQSLPGKLRQEPSGGSVALGGIGVQTLNIQVTAKRVCRQKEGGVAPIRFYGKGSGGVKLA